MKRRAVLRESKTNCLWRLVGLSGHPSTQGDPGGFWKPLSRVVAGTRKDQARRVRHEGSLSETLIWGRECTGEGSIPRGRVDGQGKMR